MACQESESREHVQRVTDSLNRFAGALHSARCTGLLWIQQAQNSDYRIAAKYGLQGAFAITVLTLRKLEDIWEHHLCFLLPATTASRAHCEQLFAECRDRNLRKTANLLIAHYAPAKNAWPLSTAEIEAIIRSNGWDSEEEVIAWVGHLIPQILAVRDDLKHCYNIKDLGDEEILP